MMSAPVIAGFNYMPFWAGDGVWEVWLSLGGAVQGVLWREVEQEVLR